MGRILKAQAERVLYVIPPIAEFLTICDDRTQAQICASSHRLELRRGELLIQEGDPSLYVFVIERGGVLLFRTDENGGEVGLDWLTTGGICGLEDAAVSRPYSASARATVRTTVCRFPAAQLRTAFVGNSETMKALASYIVDRLHRVHDQIAIYALSDIGERIRQILWRLALSTGGMARPERVLLISQADLAVLAGASRQSINRHLTELKRLGLVNIERSRILLRDPLAIRY